MQQNFEKQLKRLLLSLALVNLVLFLSCGKEGRDVGGFTEDPHKLLSRVGLEGPTELVTGECAGYTVTLFNSFQVPVMAPTTCPLSYLNKARESFIVVQTVLGSFDPP